MNNKTYNITFSINRAHLLFMCVTLYSLLKNNQQYNFDIYVLHNNCLNQNEIDDICNKHPLNQYNNFKIHLVETSNIEVLKSKTFIPSGKGFSWPKEILFKLFLHQLLPNVDTILHLDTDVLIRADIKDLFDIEDKSLFKGSLSYNNWLNAGVMLMNLKLARELEIENIIISYLLHNNATEEEIINKLFYDKKSYYSSNIVIHLFKKTKDPIKEIRVVHYLWPKPFKLNNSVFNPLFKEYYLYFSHFVKYKTRFILSYLISFFLYIVYSYKRRIIRLIKKLFKKEIKEKIKKDYLTEKIYKYSIIDKK